jgi:hypothetical protein
MLRRCWALLPICAARLFSATTPALTPLPANSIANAVQLDASGNLYLAGFFFANPSDANAPAHAFAAKLSPDASQIIWWTPLAGSQDDRAQALALGPGDSVYVTGITQSADFPTTPGAFDPAGATAGSTFAAKLDANGVVVYATYIPATSGQAIAVDAAGDAFITGALRSGDGLKATAGAVAGAPNTPGSASESAFIVELNPTGSKAALAIIGFGGTQIALDGSGNIYVAGYFLGPVAPTTPGAFQATVTARTCGSSQILVEPCAYQHIAKIDPTGARLIYATYLSGTWGAIPTGLAVDSAGNAIVAGTTNSPDYPTTPGAYQPEYSGNLSSQLLVFTLSPPASVGYVTKLNATGTGLLWSTLFGGSGGQIPNSFIVGDSIAGMAIDASSNILVAGFANSPDLPGLWNTPVASRPVAANESSGSGFVARLSADGGTLSPVQLLNGLQRDLPQPTGGAIAARADGSAIVAGEQVFTVSLSSLGRVAAICDTADDAKIVQVAPGQLITLYGTNLAPTGSAPASPLFPTSFNGVAVTFNGTAAPLFYTSGTQINLQVPYEIAGQGQVTGSSDDAGLQPVGLAGDFRILYSGSGRARAGRLHWRGGLQRPARRRCDMQRSNLRRLAAARGQRRRHGEQLLESGRARFHGYSFSEWHGGYHACPSDRRDRFIRRCGQPDGAACSRHGPGKRSADAHSGRRYLQRRASASSGRRDVVGGEPGCRRTG